MAGNNNGYGYGYGYGGERYERYNFNATEDDYIVSDILVNLEALIHNFNPSNWDEAEPITCSFKSSTSSYEPTWSMKARNLSEPLWHNKRKRSALDYPPSPPRNHMKAEGHKYEKMRIRDVKPGDKEENMVYSPSSHLSYEPNDDNNNNNKIQSRHRLKNTSKKRKLQDWEEHIRELEQTKQQLKLSLDNVRRYHQTLLEVSTKLKAKRDQKNNELKRKNQVNGGFDLKFPTGHHRFPVFARRRRQRQRQQQQKYQQGSDGLKFQYYPLQFYQANAKLVQAAEARHRRKIKINTKKKSNSLGMRSSSLS